MAEEFLGERRRFLEEEFFRKQERAVLERLQETHTRQATRDALAQASGVQDPAVLDTLIGLGIDANTLLVMGLVPVVLVAWADGTLDDKERQAITASLGSAGIAAGSPAAQLITNWLHNPPPPALFEAWKAYVSGLCARLSTAECESLRTSMLGRARAVAEAAGGFLGLGSRVSRVEEDTLHTLAGAFSS